MATLWLFLLAVGVTFGVPASPHGRLGLDQVRQMRESKVRLTLTGWMFAPDRVQFRVCDLLGSLSCWRRCECYLLLPWTLALCSRILDLPGSRDCISGTY
jgi:hypothetical protein